MKHDRKGIPCTNNRGSKFSPKKWRRAAREEEADKRRAARLAAAQAVLKR
jgi:hypothetical protein